MESNVHTLDNELPSNATLSIHPLSQDSIEREELVIGWGQWDAIIPVFPLS